MSVGLKHGFFWAGAEVEVAARVTAGAPKPKKEKFRPKLPTIQYSEFKRGQREHVRQVEAKMWAGHQEVTQVLKKTEGKKLVPDQSTKFEDLQPRKPGTQTRPPIEKAPLPPKPERPKKPPPPQPTEAERMESSRVLAANVREQHELKAHLRATRQLAEKESSAEEKKQREAEKDIGYKPTQIKRDRASRAQTYQRREDFAVNLEKGKIDKAKLQAVEDVRNEQRLKALKKARAAKKRKAKKK